MNKLFAFFSVLMIVLLMLGFKGSDDFVEKLINALTTYRKDYPQEKVYLHFDRQYYMAGETVWYKAYVVEGPFHQFSKLSKTLYVELINEKKEIVYHEKAFIPDGTGTGDIVIPETFESGNYVIRAYTNWMRNFPDQFLFTHEIKIWNPGMSGKRQPDEVQQIDLQFFPEGGDLVEGVISRVAFKAIQPTGLSMAVSGKIFNQQNQLITEFKSTHLGMGVFPLLPESDQQYYATLNNDPKTRYNLPAVQKSGIVIRVTNLADNPEVIVRLQTNNTTENYERVTLVAQIRGIPVFVVLVDLSRKISFVTIPKASLENGITHITLFDKANKPVSQRLIAIERDDGFEIEIKPSKEVYAPREMVKLDMKVGDKNQTPFLSNFSMTIVDARQILSDPDDLSINSYLHLRSEVKGHIESPGYYFNPANPGRYEALDLLLLTQGWSRFSWTEILNGRWPGVPYPIEKGLTIKGRMLDSSTKRPVKNGKVSYLSKDHYNDYKFTETDERGNFSFSDLTFFGITQAFLQGATNKGRKGGQFWIDTEYNPSPLFDLQIVPLLKDRMAYEREFIARGIQRKTIEQSYSPDSSAIMLEPVKITRSRLVEESTNQRPLGSIFADVIHTNTIGGGGNFNHPLELLQGRVAGVNITLTPPSITIRGQGSINSGTSPLILVDDIPVDIEFLAALPVPQIESVYFYKGADAAMTYGMRGANGAVAFYTKKSFSLSDLKTNGFHHAAIKGYSVPREFYSPRYDILLPEHIKPDKRVTLYWNPKLQTDENGQTKIEFFNPDDETTVLITVEGMVHFEIPGTGIYKGLPVVGSAFYKIVKQN